MNLNETGGGKDAKEEDTRLSETGTNSTNMTRCLIKRAGKGGRERGRKGGKDKVTPPIGLN